MIVDWLGDLLLGILCAVIAGLVTALNYVIAALGAMVGALIALLPAMPELPPAPDELTEVLGWVNWFFPVGTVVQFFAFIVAAWLIWQGVAIGLRWAKAVRE